MKKHVDKFVFLIFNEEYFTIWMLYFLETIYTFFNVANASIMTTE